MEEHSSFLQYRFKSGSLDPVIKEYLEANSPSEEINTLSLNPVEVRETNNNNIIQTCIEKPGAIAEIKDLQIQGPAGNIPIRIYFPGTKSVLPVLLFVHGGGWLLGNLDTHETLCRYIANKANCLLVAVDYRLAPENPYPAALDDVYSALLWVSENIAKFGGDAGRIGIFGDSSGGNIAAAIAIKSRDQNGPSLVSQLLAYPVTNTNKLETESYKNYANGYGLLKSMMAWYIKQYLRDHEQSLEPFVSPLLCENLANLPPTCILTAEFDVLRDEGEAYAKKLKEAGNEVTCIRYNGLPHGFLLRDAILKEKSKILFSELAEHQKNLFKLS